MSDEANLPPGPDDDERERYANAVEDYFLRRRRSSFLISATDRFRILQWFDEGIPLPIVLAGIAEVFDRAVATGRIGPVPSIGYCRHAVVRRFRDAQRALVGSEDEPKKRRKKDPSLEDGGGALSERFGRAAERLEAAVPFVASRLRGILAEIERIERDESSPLSDREGALIELERRFVADLLPSLPQEERAAIEADAEAPFAKHRGPIPPDDVERLREIGRLRAVRHRYALPRLTLLQR